MILRVNLPVLIGLLWQLTTGPVCAQGLNAVEQIGIPAQSVKVPRIVPGQRVDVPPPGSVLTLPEHFHEEAQGWILSSLNNININHDLGASSYYSRGYTGSTAIVANIEAGHIWNGHSTLGHVDAFINGPGTVAQLQGHQAAYDSHATRVGSMLAGRPTGSGNPEQHRGIAHGATLWSGSIATSFGTGTSFSYNSYNAFFQPYVTAALTGINGQTADVINSSWGTYGGAGFSMMSAARTLPAMGIDALALQTGKSFVFAAGNSGGDGTDTVSAPATAFNVISVGALQGTGSTPPYNLIAAFSSRGPNKVYDAANQSFVNTARIRVDIAAPGATLTLANYQPSSPNPNLFSASQNGTSFAAPAVSGGLTLMVDAGRQNGAPHSDDARVLKAIVLNSADKTYNWNNGQTLVNGVTTTSQALDPIVGAGRMNIGRALPYLTSSTATSDVPGESPGDQGLIAKVGYDLGVVNANSFNSYTVSQYTPAGSSLAVTLNWFVERGVNSFDNPTEFSEQHFADLDLEVWRVENGIFTTKVAQSWSVFNNTEHLHLTDMEEGWYGIRVQYFGDNWNFTGANHQMYAVAWAFHPAPEPLGMLFMMTVPGAAVYLRVRFRRRPDSVQDATPNL